MDVINAKATVALAKKHVEDAAKETEDPLDRLELRDPLDLLGRPELME